jgi:hypothetical protein
MPEVTPMNYELGIRTLKARLPEDALNDFNVHEARLLENMRRERLYGSTETTRAERAAIVDALNQLAQTRLGMSFNELCQPAKAPAYSTHDVSRADRPREGDTASLRRQLEEAEKNLRLIEERKSQYVLEVDVPLQLIKEERSLRERIGELERELNGLDIGRPPLPATTHVLTFDRLSPVDFERLCLWLVEREGYTRAEHLGLAGSEQGRDVVAYRPTPRGEELWYFQCKRYRSINTKTLSDEVDKYLQLAQDKPHLRPAGVVFVISCAVSAKVREEVGTYCEQHDLAHEFWGLTELDMRVKHHPDLLQEFFNLAP